MVLFCAISSNRFCLAADSEIFKTSEELMEAGNYQGALEEINKILLSDPANSQAYFNRGYTYVKLEDYDKAIADYSKAIELDDIFSVRFLRAKAYLEVGQLDKAIEDYTVGIDQKNYWRKNLSAINNPDQKTLEEMKKMEDLVAADDEEVTAYYFRGAAYEDKGDSRKAIRDYSAAINLKSDFLAIAELYSARAMAYLNMNQPSKALADANKAVELKPGSKNVYLARAFSHLAMDEYDKALEDSYKAVPGEIEDESFNGVYHIRASAYLHKGNFEKSAANVKKAQELGYEYDEEFLNNLKKSR